MNKKEPAPCSAGPQNVQAILDILAATYPEAHCELNFSSAFELLIATMLSAQATDKKVNQVTAKLFSNYQTPEQFLTLSLNEMEKAIRELGLYHNKAQNILATCQILVEDYGGEIPDSREALLRLPGVGRKTANVVLSNAFQIPALAVDTHVARVANRLGLAAGTNPELIERQLLNCIPRSQWIQAHHWLIWHGRRICAARNPKCPACPLASRCPGALLPVNSQLQ